MLECRGDDPEVEYLGGRAAPKVSPKRRHAVVQGTLWAIVDELGRGFGTTGTEWRFAIDDAPGKRTSLVPDVAFMSYERWRPLSSEEREEPPCAPDVAVEIRSPGDRLADVRWKMQAYLAAGASLALDVLPLERRIVAYARGGTREFDAGATFEHESVPWLRFAVAGAFSRLDLTEGT